jgi:anti-anti-sigma factor
MPDTQVSSDFNPTQVPVPSSAFDYTLGDGGFGVTWVRVAGELDHATAPQFASMLSQAMRLAWIVIVDLRGLTRVDSSGVGAIVDASRGARRDAKRLIFVRGLPRVERLLALTGTSGAVEMVDLAAGEPPVLALLQIAQNDLADTPKRAHVSQRRWERARSPTASRH